MALVIDSHAQVLPRWPHQPAVPDLGTRASGEHLVFELGANGVDQAVLTAARLEGSADTNEYVAGALKRYPGRFHHFVDSGMLPHHLRLVLLWKDGVDDGLRRILRTGDGHGPRREPRRAASRCARSPRLRPRLRTARQVQGGSQ